MRIKIKSTIITEFSYLKLLRWGSRFLISGPSLLDKLSSAFDMDGDAASLFKWWSSKFAIEYSQTDCLLFTACFSRTVSIILYALWGSKNCKFCANLPLHSQPLKIIPLRTRVAPAPLNQIDGPLSHVPIIIFYEIKFKCMFCKYMIDNLGEYVRIYWRVLLSHEWSFRFKFWTYALIDCRRLMTTRYSDHFITARWYVARKRRRGVCHMHAVS